MTGLPSPWFSDLARENWKFLLLDLVFRQYLNWSRKRELKDSPIHRLELRLLLISQERIERSYSSAFREMVRLLISQERIERRGCLPALCPWISPLISQERIERLRLSPQISRCIALISQERIERTIYELFENTPQQLHLISQERIESTCHAIVWWL